MQLHMTIGSHRRPSATPSFTLNCRRPRWCPAQRPMAAAGANSQRSQGVLDVAVIGGGPGGLAVASAILTTRPELSVQVFERSVLRPRGAAINVAPNGIRALAAINADLAQAVLALDCTPDTVKIHSRDGNELNVQTGEQRYSAFVRERGGPQSLCGWHQLQSLLAAHLPPGLLHQQAVFDRYEEADEGVTIHFQGGRPPVTARLLVGCDGGQSAVRKQCIGDGPPVFAGAAIWRAVLPPPDWWPTNASDYLFYGEAPTMFTAYKLHGGSLSWLGVAPWPEERLEEIGGAGAAYVQDTVARQEAGEARRQRALGVFGSWCPKIRSMIEGADALAITEHGQLYRHPHSCKVWGRGRVTLAGDAAHLATPLLTQGSSQSFEDAVALGRAIGEHGPTPEALRAYEAFRQPQMEVVHRTSVQEFLKRMEGKPTQAEYEINDELGVWRRSFPPLRTSKGATA
ncbi:hypothetical protein D9Q98_008332 [Chlorella vulgaris]|uniref:FAD-binding domain-containing protein n=1 Tax=Chlorella vulgaris TaxID=3077 RepID=A0A9D4TGI6_CHLVU|nr:hypothetical protein D9Q98_008332 [Chlorella vulgaris]